MSASQFEATRRQLERLNRLYAMLSRINRTIIRAESPSEIHTAACRIAIEEGNLAFALITLIDPHERRPLTVASAGNAPPPADLPMLTDADVASTTTVINDIAGDQRTAGARAALDQRGIEALATFPLRLEGAVVGLFAVGANATDYFGNGETRLLEEVADDISFAMDVLRRDEKRLAGEAKMHYLAYYDPRTGLPGRPLFEERLVGLCAEHNEQVVAVMVIQLHRYHGVLQALGQGAGITVARTIAARLEAALPTAVAARIGEAEFAVALGCPDELHVIEETAWRLQRAIAEPVTVDGQDVFADPFVGIAIHPRDGSPAEVLKDALIAAGRRSNDSANCCRFFVPEMDRGSRSRLALDASLRRAVARREFELYYQPQVDLVSGQVVGAEALLRWHRPEYGLVAPADFIDMLEETGLICEVGQWVLAEACAAAKRWQNAGLTAIRVAVNLSGRQFYQTNINSQVRSALHNAQLPPRCLELEVTESIILPNADAIIRTLRDLAALDVSLALDDFGTGYSSLSYLQRLPVRRLKIDRSFVANITSDPSDAAIVRAVVGMAHSLGIGVIAEGVESEGQLGFLRGLRCEQIQGYYFSPPLNEAEFVTLLRDGRSIPARQPDLQERVLLLVDDEPNILSALRRLLRGSGIKVLATTRPSEGFELLAANPVGVVVCDQRMPEITGTEFLRRVKELYPATVRIVLSGYTELNSVIDAVNRGAIYKFLTKPWQDDVMVDCLEEAFRLHELERESRLLSKQFRDRPAAGN